MASAFQPPAEATPSPSARWPAPWIFSILIMPQGLYLGFITTVLPFVLSRAHIPVDKIAEITSTLSLPWVVCFLWAPLVDVKLRRRTWLIVAASITAVCLSFALPLANSGQVAPAFALGLIGAVAASLVLATCGGLMAVALSPSAQGKASSWYEGGKLAASALGAALMLWLSDRIVPVYLGVVIVLLVSVPALAALKIPESAPLDSSWFKGRFGEIRAEVKLILSSQGKWNVLLLASPVGAGAALTLLPALASQYKVGASGVIWVNGVGGGVVLALGSLCGALLPGTWDRRLTYVGAGATNAMAAIILLWGFRPEVYFIGTILYLSTTGLCWSRYAALLVETVGSSGRDASTRYSLLAAAGNIPLAYMVWLDGAAFKGFGINGLFLIDAAANLLLFAVVVSLGTIQQMNLRQRR